LELTGKPQWENFCLANRLLTGHSQHVDNLAAHLV